jgi:hypothetical protein
MAEGENPPEGPKSVQAVDVKVGYVVVDSRGRNLEVIGVDTSGRWANLQFRAPDGLEFEIAYSKDKQLTVAPIPKFRCAECGAYVFGSQVNNADLPICDYCASRGSPKQ